MAQRPLGPVSDAGKNRIDGASRSGDLLISVVVPCHNEEKNIPVLHAALRDALAGSRREFIFVDDGSLDGTLQALRRLAAEDSSVSYISFSRNFGHQIALRAGLDAARGDCTVSLDADMQHPPALIPRLLEDWRNGVDVVLTKRMDGKKTPLLKRLTSRLFYSVLRKTFGVSIVEGSADFRLLDRSVVDALKEFKDPAPFYRGLVGLVGFRQSIVEYEVGERLYGQSKYSLRKMFSLARAGVVSTTVQPLRFAFGFSILFFLFFIYYAAYVIYVAAFGEGAVAGWASVALLLSLVGFMQALSLAILSEYVAQISMSTRGRPSYIVRERAGRTFAEEKDDG